MRDRLRAAWGRDVFVEPVLTGHGQNALIFRFRVQDPGSPDHVENLMAQADMGTSHLEVLAVELALDAYPKGTATQQELAAAAFHLHAHQKTPPRGAARLARPNAAGGAIIAPRAREALDGLVAGYTLHLGETRPGVEDPFATRWYVKAHDTQPHGAPHADLPLVEHRARMEATLRGTLCPFRTLGNWRTFRFETLTCHFAQVARKPSAPNLSVENQQTLNVLQASGYGHRLGRPADSLKAAQHRRQGLRTTRADSALNKRIHDALRRLTGAMKPGSA